MTSRRLTDLETEQVLAQLDTVAHKTLFLLGVKTGFRISELLSLRVKDVMGDTLTVGRSQMKGKDRSRSVPIHPGAKHQLKEYITQLKGPEAKLFPFTRQHAWRIIRRAAHRAGLAGCVSTHSMRKTFGMKVYERTDKNIVAAQKALGHKSLASTSHYLSVDQELVDQAILGD